jgi:hypothetical protein
MLAECRLSKPWLEPEGATMAFADLDYREINTSKMDVVAKVYPVIFRID